MKNAILAFLAIMFGINAYFLATSSQLCAQVNSSYERTSTATLETSRINENVEKLRESNLVLQMNADKLRIERLELEKRLPHE